MKKRQEIGRGLRLPVDQNGVRVFDESVNKLYVMANESYEDFARALQTEYEEDCGVTFGKVPLTALAQKSSVSSTVSSSRSVAKTLKLFARFLSNKKCLTRKDASNLHSILKRRTLIWNCPRRFAILPRRNRSFVGLPD